MREGKKVLLGLVAVLLVLGLAVSESWAQAGKKFVLRFNHVLAPADPYHAGFQRWAKAVSERTNGGLEIQVFHSAQLGVEEDIIEQIRAGANIGQNTDSARLGNFVPEIAVMNAPYFVDNYHDVFKLSELPSIRAWTARLEKEFGIKVLSFNWVQGFRHMITNKPVRRPEDLRGMRIRTPGAPIWQESIRALGATPVALAFREIYPALQQRVIDGADNVYNATFAGKLFEVARYVNETSHILLINFQIVGSKFFNSLPAEYQRILVEECDRAGIETSRMVMDTLSAESKQHLIKHGMTIISDVDIEAFKKAGERAYEVLKLTEARRQVFREMGRKF